jgi:hypothetical protein
MSSHTNITTAAGSSCIRAVSGVWTKKSDETAPSSEEVVEVVARPETSADMAIPTHPSATYSACQGSRNMSNTFDGFFGAGALEAHRPLSYATTSPPPPYVPQDYEVTEKQTGEATEVPSVEEPDTLARIFFIYGFCESPCM